MNISFNIDGVQEGKTYTLEFTIREGVATTPATRSTSSKSNKSKPKEKKDEAPSLDEFEPEAPKLEEPKPKTKPEDIKIESSFGDGRIDPKG